MEVEFPSLHPLDEIGNFYDYDFIIMLTMCSILLRERYSLRAYARLPVYHTYNFISAFFLDYSNPNGGLNPQSSDESSSGGAKLYLTQP